MKAALLSTKEPTCRLRSNIKKRNLTTKNRNHLTIKKIKKKKTLTFKSCKKVMYLEWIIWSDVTQSRKERTCMLSLVCGI